MIPRKQYSRRFLLIILLILFAFPIHVNFGTSFQSIQKVAVIIDTPQFYDSVFIDDILNGFDAVNETYGIDYEAYLLTNYTEITRSPYVVSYTHNQTTTNHSRLAKEIIDSGRFDIIVVAGYVLRWGFLDITEYPQTDFLFYDLSGEEPFYSGDGFPSNLAIVSFRENELGYIAGALAMATLNPDHVALIGTSQGDPRSQQLLAGFQSAVFRNATQINEARINYINHWVDPTTANEAGNSLKSEFNVLFAGVQSNNTDGIRQGFTGTGKQVISVDSNQSFSVMKNNTKVLLSMFNLYNQTGFFGAKVSYGIEDNVFYPTDWGDSIQVNQTMHQIYQDVVVNELEIPTNLQLALNTPGFDWVTLFGILILISALISRRPRSSERNG